MSKITRVGADLAKRVIQVHAVANDAAAICEAASRPQMHFVPAKTIEQQSMLSIHCLREGFKNERTACINRIRGLLAEFGLVFAQKPAVLRQAAGSNRGRKQRTGHAGAPCAAARLAAMARAGCTYGLV